MNLAPLAPHPIVHRPILVLHDPVPMRPVIVVDVPRVPSVLAILVLRSEIAYADALLPPARRLAGLAGFKRRCVRARVVEYPSRPGLASGWLLPSSAAAAAVVIVRALGTDVVNDFKPPQRLLLRQLDVGMTAAVPVPVEREAAVPSRFRGPPGLRAGRRALRGPCALPRARRSLGREGDVVGSHVLSVARRAGSYDLEPRPEHAFLRHLDVGVQYAASVLVELAAGVSSPSPPLVAASSAVGRQRPGRFSRGVGPHRSVIVITAVELVLHALGARGVQHLPSPRHLLGGELDVLVVVASALGVEGRVVLAALLAGGFALPALGRGTGRRSRRRPLPALGPAALPALGPVAMIAVVIAAVVIAARRALVPVPAAPGR
mmetsp:Transcript_26960/g.64734  ORF Transcript_26960/g.64734 Transcript_26960/m.64734 type:complete len:377 (-) Transcript_26960:434-1564(-)